MIMSLERSLRVRKPSRVEAADVAGVQPAVAQRLGGGLRVVPVAGHHHVAADHDLADLAGRQRAALARRRPHLDAGARDADRAERARGARVRAVGVGGLRRGR